MNPFAWTSAAAVLLLMAASAAEAAQRTVVLAVDNMTCASCPYIVRESLARVEGVQAVEVSFEAGKAVVTFDDHLTDPSALVQATAQVGFPSRVLEPDG